MTTPSEECLRRARELFDKIDGPFVALTPLGEEKVTLIATALQEADDLRTMQVAVLQEKYRNSELVNWKQLHEDNEDRIASLSADLTASQERVRVLEGYMNNCDLCRLELKLLGPTEGQKEEGK